MATTAPLSFVDGLGRAEAAPTSLTDPSDVASHSAASGLDASEPMGGSGAGGVVVEVLGGVVVVVGATVVLVVDSGTRVVDVVGAPVRTCATGTVVVGAGIVVVVPADAGVAGTVVDVVEVLRNEVPCEEFCPDDVGESAACNGCAPASGASSASIPVAADDNPNVALSDHTTVRTNF